MSEDNARRERLAGRLKERIYVTFAALGVTVTLATHGHVEALDAITTLLVTVLGTLAAVFTADLISHVLVHERLVRGRELWDAATTSFSALTAIGVPLILLTVSAATGWPPTHAIAASAASLLLALVFFGYVAIRRVPLRFWQRVLILGSEAVIGALVITLQIVAHGG